MNFPFHEAKYESIACNLCQRDEPVVLADHGRGGLAVQTCICKYCGLIYVNPRMTQEWYGRFYHEGYRDYLDADKGRVRLNSAAGLEHIFESGERFGRALAEQVKTHLLPGVTLEVGSSAGGILSAFRSIRSDLEVRGIEPSEKEAAFARGRGIPTEITLFENYREKTGPVANIFIARSLNHLLDPRAFFTWAHGALAPGGRIMVAVQDFRLSAKKKGSVERAAQIDHTYMFVRETLESFLRAGGFDILFLDASEGKSTREVAAMRARGLTDHLRIVGVRSERTPFREGAIPPLGPTVLASFSRGRIIRAHLPYAWRSFRKRVHRYFGMN